MSVLEHIKDKLRSEKLHMALIDPDKQEPDVAGEMASIALGAGTDAIMIGGSTGVTQSILDQTAMAIKENVDIPVILFPTNARALTGHVDAIYFMSMLNTTTPEYIIRQQARGAPVIKKLGVEPISMGYIIVEPGMRVAEVGGADPIKRDDHVRAVGYSLAAQYLGMSLVYLEAGSGANEHVPSEMISAVKREIDIPLIVGGGITTPELAREVVCAGADIVVTGTLMERSHDLHGAIASMVQAIKSC